jgi:hypothetical protein
MVFAEQIQIDSPKLDARTDELFDLFENPLLARNRPLPVCRGLPAEVHLCRLTEGQTALICCPRAALFNRFMFLLLKIRFESKGPGRIVGIRGLLMLASMFIAPVKADVRRPWIPAKSAEECWPFPVFHGECVFRQNRRSVKRGKGSRYMPLRCHAKTATGAAEQRRSFPGSSLTGTGIPQNSLTKSYDKMLRQRLFREDDEA